MELKLKNPTKTTLEFENSYDRSGVGKIVSPHIGKVARLGFAFNRTRVEVTNPFGLFGYPLRVNIPNSELPGVMEDAKERGEVVAGEIRSVQEQDNSYRDEHSPRLILLNRELSNLSELSQKIHSTLDAETK